MYVYVYDVYVYVYVCIYVCVYILVPKYVLSSTYNVTCMYIFRAGHLALGNQLVCSSLWEIAFPTPSFPQLPIVLYVGWCILGFPPHPLWHVH